jgi:hypothetical protein
LRVPIRLDAFEPINVKEHTTWTDRTFRHRRGMGGGRFVGGNPGRAFGSRELMSTRMARAILQGATIRAPLLRVRLR